LFFELQGVQTTRLNPLELLFLVVLATKIYLKKYVQGEQKTRTTIIFVHTLYTVNRIEVLALRRLVQ